MIPFITPLFCTISVSNSIPFCLNNPRCLYLRPIFNKIFDLACLSCLNNHTRSVVFGARKLYTLFIACAFVASAPNKSVFMPAYALSISLNALRFCFPCKCSNPRRLPFPLPQKSKPQHPAYNASL